MRREKAKPVVSGVLRETIRERGLTAYSTAKRAGVSVDAVQRFLNDERGLTLATVDRLAVALDLTLCPEEPAVAESDRSGQSSGRGQSAPAAERPKGRRGGSKKTPR